MVVGVGTPEVGYYLVLESTRCMVPLRDLEIQYHSVSSIESCALDLHLARGESTVLLTASGSREPTDCNPIVLLVIQAPVPHRTIDNLGSDNKGSVV